MVAHAGDVLAGHSIPVNGAYCQRAEPTARESPNRVRGRVRAHPGISPPRGRTGRRQKRRKKQVRRLAQLGLDWPNNTMRQRKRGRSNSPPWRRRRRRARPRVPRASPSILQKQASAVNRSSGNCGRSVLRLRQFNLPAEEGQSEAPVSTASSAARKMSTPARSPVTTAARHPRRAEC